MSKRNYNSFFMNFANPTKFNILLSLRNKPLSVSEIAEKLNEEQSKVSHNLSHMTGCHVLNVKQKGKQRIYSLNKETVIPILEIIEKHIQTNCKNKQCDRREI